MITSNDCYAGSKHHMFANSNLCSSTHKYIVNTNADVILKIKIVLSKNLKSIWYNNIATTRAKSSIFNKIFKQEIKQTSFHTQNISLSFKNVSSHDFLCRNNNILRLTSIYSSNFR